MRSMLPALTMCLALCIGAGLAAAAQPLPSGSDQQEIKLRGETLKIFTYRPKCSEPSLLIVLHGVDRNADDYRDWARPLAGEHCLLIVAPEFDRKRFPTWRYQHGGVERHGEVQPRNEWTANMVVALAGLVRTAEARMLPYSLIGHSAGAQFLSRLAAFSTTDAQRIVIANPGTHVFPDAKVEAPFGFGKVYPENAVEGGLRAYLAQPVTIYLGKDDTEEKNLNEGASAMAQGENRHARGLNAFRAAQALAQSHSWQFNWRLIETPGIGHKAEKMFAAKEAWDSLKP